MTENHPNPAATLFQISGAPPRPATLSDSVLIVIDAQHEYVSGRLPLTGIADAIAETSRLLAAARTAGTPVIHVVHHSSPGAALFDPQTVFAEVVPQLAPLPTEEVVIKHLPNAFAGTTLEARLKAIAAATGRKKIILAGFMTHMCISATARVALDLGIAATVVAGACATRDVPNPLGGVVAARTLHEAALAAIADRFATVVSDASALSGAGAAAA